MTHLEVNVSTTCIIILLYSHGIVCSRKLPHAELTTAYKLEKMRVHVAAYIIMHLYCAIITFHDNHVVFVIILLYTNYNNNIPIQVYACNIFVYIINELLILDYDKTYKIILLLLVLHTISCIAL